MEVYVTNYGIKEVEVMECIVHFRVVHDEEIKELRGLIFTDDGAAPNMNQLTEMFGNMGYNVRADQTDELVFKPTDAKSGYKYIRVTELDTGEEVYSEDRNLRALLENLLPRR